MAVSTTLVSFDEADLHGGDVLVQVDYSTLNYKDSLAMTNRSPIIRSFPMIPGIDRRHRTRIQPRRLPRGRARSAQRLRPEPDSPRRLWPSARACPANGW